MGLVLTRRAGDSIQIGEAKVEIISIAHRRVRLHIDAPPEVQIDRPDSAFATQPRSLADRLVAKIQEAERLLGRDSPYAPILEQTRAMIRREEQNQ